MYCGGGVAALTMKAIKNTAAHIPSNAARTLPSRTPSISFAAKMMTGTKTITR